MQPIHEVIARLEKLDKDIQDVRRFENNTETLLNELRNLVQLTLERVDEIARRSRF